MENEEIKKEEITGKNDNKSKKEKPIKEPKPQKPIVNKKAVKAGAHLQKFENKNKVNLKLYDTLALTYTDNIDIEEMAYSVASVESTYLKYFQSVIFDGYDYNFTNAVKTNGKETRSEAYTKAVILFGDRKMLLYSYSFALCGGIDKKVYAEIYYKNISSITIVNETTERISGKEKYLVANNFLKINAGESYILPLQNVKSFDDKPVLKEMLRFIESRKV